eukprot:1160105-Pelagomonas_calceolata.AAC.9
MGGLPQPHAMGAEVVEQRWSPWGWGAATRWLPLRPANGSATHLCSRELQWDESGWNLCEGACMYCCVCPAPIASMWRVR